MHFHTFLKYYQDGIIIISIIIIIIIKVLLLRFFKMPSFGIRQMRLKRK